jgi:hypothetical protein
MRATVPGLARTGRSYPGTTGWASNPQHTGVKGPGAAKTADVAWSGAVTSSRTA